jgi:hypothetical protein
MEYVEFEPDDDKKNLQWRRVIVTSEVNGGEYETETIVITYERILSIRVETIDDENKTTG